MTTVSPDAARSALRARWKQESDVECRYPELSLRVWATPEGMKLLALLYMPGGRYSRPLVVLQSAVWQPSEVTEVAVVDWGRRALAKWLEDQLVSPEE